MKFLIGTITQNVRMYSGHEVPSIKREITWDQDYGLSIEHSLFMRNSRAVTAKERREESLKKGVFHIARLVQVAQRADAVAPGTSYTYYDVHLLDEASQTMQPYMHADRTKEQIEERLRSAVRAAHKIEKEKSEQQRLEETRHAFDVLWHSLRDHLKDRIAATDGSRAQPTDWYANRLFGLLSEYCIQADNTDIADIHAEALAQLLGGVGYVRNEHVGTPLAAFTGQHMRRAYYAGQIMDYLLRGSRPHQSIGFCIVKRGLTMDEV